MIGVRKRAGCFIGVWTKQAQKHLLASTSSLRNKKIYRLCCFLLTGLIDTFLQLCPEGLAVCLVRVALIIASRFLIKTILDFKKKLALLEADFSLSLESSFTPDMTHLLRQLDSAGASNPFVTPRVLPLTLSQRPSEFSVPLWA